MPEHPGTPVTAPGATAHKPRLLRRLGDVHNLVTAWAEASLANWLMVNQTNAGEVQCAVLTVEVDPEETARLVQR